MATYNISRHRKQKTAALMLLQDELLRIVSEPTSGNVVRLKAPGPQVHSMRNVAG
jgi:hypothetical protein